MVCASFASLVDPETETAACTAWVIVPAPAAYGKSFFGGAGRPGL